MKSISLISFIRNSVEDDYVMNVFYNIVKDSFVKNDFSLSNVSSIYIDGRFFGEVTNVSLRAKYNKTPKHALALLLSIRLLMLNPKFIKYCNEDNLIITSRTEESFQWVEFMAFILDNWEDEDIKMLYSMLENFYFDDEFTEEEKEEFRSSIEIPEYRNEKVYYRGLASTTTGVANHVIGNNAFLEAQIKKYVITKDIEYVGDTAFSYCENLETLEFEDKVMFGTFPIIECLKLTRIIVPSPLLDYYKEELQYYENIISDNEINEIKEQKEVLAAKRNVASPQLTDESEIEHVYVHIPSADPYQEIEIEEVPQNEAKAQEEPNVTIEPKMLDKVFEKKATSYKYFWFLSLISLAKETDSLVISYKDIVIRMAALAWPMIMEDEIDLGGRDMMAKYLGEITKKTSLINTATSKVVENYMRQHYSSQGIEQILAPLLKNVPYRFLSPWVPFTTIEEVIAKSKSTKFAGLYALQDKGIEVNRLWWEYISPKYLEICDFAERSFVAYAKQYNNQMKLLKLMSNGWNLIRK